MEKTKNTDVFQNTLFAPTGGVPKINMWRGMSVHDKYRVNRAIISALSTQRLFYLNFDSLEVRETISQASLYPHTSRMYTA